MGFVPVRSPSTGKVLFHLDAARLLIEIVERRDLYRKGVRTSSEKLLTLVDLAVYLEGKPETK